MIRTQHIHRWKSKKNIGTYDNQKNLYYPWMRTYNIFVIYWSILVLIYYLNSKKLDLIIIVERIIVNGNCKYKY